MKGRSVTNLTHSGSMSTPRCPCGSLLLDSEEWRPVYERGFCSVECELKYTPFAGDHALMAVSAMPAKKQLPLSVAFDSDDFWNYAPQWERCELFV